jgi:hypothetical protein
VGVDRVDKGERRRREDHRNAVEYLCTHLAELTDLLTAPKWPESLGALAAETPFTEPWYAAVRSLHDLAEERVIGGLGLTNPMGVDDWPGAHGGGERIGAWVCPAEVCSRVELDRETGPTPPECRLHTRPMTHVEV